MSRKCMHCGRTVFEQECPNCESSDLLDDIIDIGLVVAAESIIDGIFNDSGSSISNPINDLPGTEFGGGTFGGAGSGGDW